MPKQQNLNENKPDQLEFSEKIVEINRTSKKTKGGNRLSFTSLMVLGDNNGRVGVGLGKAGDVRSAIEKGKRRAKKNLQTVVIKGEAKTLPHPIRFKEKAAQVLLKRAPAGTGIRAGGPMRAVLEVAGYKNVVGKVLGSNNKKQNVYATLSALSKISELTEKHEARTT